METKRGRKTKYTPETVQAIVTAIKMGSTYELAAQYGGIHVATFYEWMKTKREFYDAVKSAEGAGAVALLARIRKEADEGTWQAAAWILERRYPQQYGRRAVEVTGEGGGPLQVNMVFADVDLYKESDDDA